MLLLLEVVTVDYCCQLLSEFHVNIQYTGTCCQVNVVNYRQITIQGDLKNLEMTGNCQRKFLSGNTDYCRLHF